MLLAATVKSTTVSAAGLAPSLSCTSDAWMVKVQVSSATSAVPVSMVKLVPLLAWDSTMPVLAVQDRVKAPGDTVTASLNSTTRSPADGKLLSPSIGVVESTTGGWFTMGAAGTKVMVPGPASASATPS